VLTRADAALIDAALSRTPTELRAAARRWRARHVPRTDEQRAQALGHRRVEVSPADDDLCWLSALLPAAQAMAIYHRIDDVAAAVAGPDEVRTMDQLRADVLSAMLLDPEGTALANPLVGAASRSEVARPALAAPDMPSAAPDNAAAASGLPTVSMPGWLRGVRPTVVLTVPVLSLLGRGDEPAELEGFGPIDLETARQLAAQALSFVRVLTDPQTGAVLSVGRDRYRVPADLRTALLVRDATCRFPGCRRRAARCDLDHSIAWQDGGCTELGNLAHLCRKHHRLKHEAGWTVTHDDGGILTWTSPVGRVYRTEPATTLWPPTPAPPPPRAAAPPITIQARPGGYPDEPTF
jgi:hypothetical protein